MNTLDQLLISTWLRLEPVHRAYRLERHRRLVRSAGRGMSRPIRPWCIVLRANDTRLERRASLVPYRASEDGEPHHVILDTVDLRELARPVYLREPVERRVAAARLGRSLTEIKALLDRGALEEERVPGGRGSHRARGRSLVWAPGALDPNARNLAPPHPVWGSAWVHHHTRVPLGLTTVLRRVPVYRGRQGGEGRRGGRFWGWRFECPGPRPLAPLPEDLSEAPGALERSRHACGRLVQQLYLPLPVFTVQDFLGTSERSGPAGAEQDGGMKAEAAPLYLACAACVELRDFSAGTTGAWNVFVTAMTGGLLYGSDVPEPEGWWRGRVG